MKDELAEIGVCEMSEGEGGTLKDQMEGNLSSLSITSVKV
jgi:hypothetical protein